MKTTNDNKQREIIRANVADWRRKHRHTITRDGRFDPQFKVNVGETIERARHEHSNT